MKKIISLVLFLITAIPCFALTMPDYSVEIQEERNAQKNIDDIGYKLLNANKVPVRMVFLYKDKDKKYLRDTSELTKRQIIVYRNMIKFTENDDEVAAMLAREISAVKETYKGEFSGGIGAAQLKLAPKKYQIYCDKRAVDYLVNAGYNPLGVITYIHKAYPQKRFDKFSRTNLTSKRLANVYEYIFTKYPYYLKNNEYLHNDVYQNFLLTSRKNREKLRQKIEYHEKDAVKYE